MVPFEVSVFSSWVTGLLTVLDESMVCLVKEEIFKQVLALFPVHDVQ